MAKQRSVPCVSVDMHGEAPPLPLSTGDSTFRFSDWRADPNRNLLQRGDHEVRVTPRSMEVLVYLLSQKGRVVSKDELLREVWNGQAVTDDALIVTVYELRKALGDRAREPVYLETVPRRGYRFVPAVQVETGAQPEPLTASAEPAASQDSRPKEASTQPSIEPSPEPSFNAARRSRWPLMWLAALLISGVIIAFASQRSDPASPELAGADDPTIEALLVEARKRIDLRTPADLERAADAYRRLLTRLPGDARAEAGLARVAATRADLLIGDRFELYHEAKSRAARALESGADLTDAHLALGTTQLLLDWDLTQATISLERAVKKEPENPDVHQVLGWLLSARGDHAAAEEAARRSVELDPESANRRADLAFLLLIGGRPSAALREAEAALVLDANNISAALVLIRTHLAGADFEAAQATLLSMVGPAPEAGVDNPLAALDFWTLLGKILPHMPPKEALTFRAGLSARAGRIDRALGFLEVAFAQRGWEVLWLEHLPELAPLRLEPRFLELLKRRDARR